jgi:hypothetical protein
MAGIFPDDSGTWLDFVLSAEHAWQRLARYGTTHMVRIIILVTGLVLLAGCATVERLTLDERYGQQDIARFDTPVKPPHGMSYRNDIQPILNRRCVVCHACYDAQCQLKLSAWEGIARGATKEMVYDSARILEAPTTRLFVDAGKASAWRARDFHPVLNERSQTPAANLSASLLFRMLDLKRRHPLPDVKVLPESFDFSLGREQQCASIEEFDRFEQKYPQWGMPYGMPGLSDAELATLVRWLEQGAPYEGPAPLPPGVEQQVRQWELFLNGDSLKEQLTSRYIYEHLFLAHLHFDADPERHYFRLVRSSTPPGQPIREITTRRPYDDPGVNRVYYRLAPEHETVVAKTHMPYALGPKRMALWRQLFLAPDYTVDALPSYAPDIAANPFLAFQSLPVNARYRFMLDEAEITIMNFIKGPVCRGQVALNVIEDHFWVFFLNPRDISAEADAEFLARESSNLRLPSEKGSNALILKTWAEYSRLQNKYLQAKSEYMQSKFHAPSKVTLDVIWDGDGRNPNAALTVFRHFDSASVVKGLVGEPPKTAWLIGYPLLERIHYLLVAGFDVYGNAGHQLNSRLYMDFLRMEGEFNFIALLPREKREAVRDYWYRGASTSVKDYLHGSNAWFDQESGIDYRSTDPQRELYDLLRARLAPVLGNGFDLSTVKSQALRNELRTLAAVRGRSLAFMPETGFLRLDDPAGPSRYFTLLRNTGHSNVTHLMKESKALLPDENTLTVVPGFIGAYPNVLYVMPRAALPEFTEAVRRLSSEADYQALADRFAVRRTHPEFWTYSDALQSAYARVDPDEAGLFDYNRLENR